MKTLQIATIFRLNNAFGQGVLSGVSDFARLHPEWVNLFFDEKAVLDPEFFSNYQIDGLIVHLPTQDLATIVRKSGKPFVNVSNRLFTPPVPTVTSKDKAVGQLVAQYFIKKQYQRLAFVSHQRKLSYEERWEGYSQEAATAGIEPQPFWIETDSSTAHYLNRHGKRLKKWLHSLTPPTAIFTSSDRCSMFLIDICLREGFRIPEDFSIVGVDNDQLKSSMSRVPLSSVQLGVETIGFRAAKTLSDLLTQGHSPKQPSRILIPPIRVVERTSSEHFSVDDTLVLEALDYMRTRIHLPIEIEQMARHIGVSRRKLERRWRKSMNNSILAELQLLRVQKAKDLLTESRLTCKEIASLTGLPDNRSLTLLFKRIEGCTPTAFRDRQNVIRL